MKLIATVISDTHSREKKIKMPKLKTGSGIKNILIHCGDFSYNRRSFNDFLNWYAEVPGYDYRVLIAGNHDEIVRDMGRDEMMQICGILDIIYLQDSSITIEGIKFHGSPWSVTFGDWAFMMDDFELDQHWQKIPDDTNVLIVHGPAYGKCDKVEQNIPNRHVGSRTLEMRTRDLKDLKFLFSGHIHDSGGEINQDGHFLTYNASIMNFWFRPDNQPHIFEIS
jgi:Icc-related predicted phosphoesterase